MIANPKYSFLESDYLNPNLCEKVKVVNKKEIKLNEEAKTNKFLSVGIFGATLTMLITPTIVFADTFGNIHKSVMNMFDSAVVLIITFSGALWMLGHRSRAIELLIGCCCGYLLARNSLAIRDFLKSI